MRKFPTLFNLVLSISFMAAGPAMANDFGVNTGPLPDGCVKFENGEIGQEGVVKTIDGVTITLFDWLEKTGEPGEYVGFSFTAEGGSVSFSVKSGQDIHEGNSSPWVNPNGTQGSSVKAISNIVFCVGDGGGTAAAAAMGFSDPAIARFATWGTLKTRFN